MSNRSGTNYSTPRDANRVPFLTAASTADGITPVVLEADPTTHQLQVSSSGGGGGGTQYTDGSSTIAHPIGTIPVYDKAGTITAVSVANPLPGTVSDGTNIANVVAGDTGFNGLATSSATKTYTFTTSTSGAQTLLANTSIEGYATVDVIFTSLGSGLSIDGVFSPNTGGTYITPQNWLFADSSANTPSFLRNIVSTGHVFRAASLGNFFQLNVTALTSGTVSGYVILRGTAPNTLNTFANQLSTWNVGTASAVVNVGQQTSNTSAVQLSASSTVPTNGIVIEALIANAAVVYIGGSGVTTSTGFQLSPGQSLTLTCNLNTIYVIGSNATDKVCWSVA